MRNIKETRQKKWESEETFSEEAMSNFKAELPDLFLGPGFAFWKDR